jgi:hypothetical protein
MDMNNALPTNGIAVLNFGLLPSPDDNCFLETSCLDFDAYKKLPDVLAFAGDKYVKTGWNSDTGRACFKTGRPFAVAV